MTSAATSEHALASDTRLFLSRIFPDDPLPGWIELRAWGADKRAVERHFARSVADAERIVAELVRRRLNVFVGIALRRTPDSGRKDNLLCVSAFWADIDDLTDIGAREEFEIRLADFPHTPSITVWSGGGLHCYWCLREPYDLTTPERVAYFEARLRGIAQRLHADSSCCEAARVLRVPGSVHFPDKAKRDKGRVPGLCVALRGLR